MCRPLAMGNVTRCLRLGTALLPAYDEVYRGTMILLLCLEQMVPPERKQGGNIVQLMGIVIQAYGGVKRKINNNNEIVPRAKTRTLHLAVSNVVNCVPLRQVTVRRTLGLQLLYPAPLRATILVWRAQRVLSLLFLLGDKLAAGVEHNSSSQGWRQDMIGIMI